MRKYLFASLIFFSIILLTFQAAGQNNLDEEYQPVRIYDLNDWISFKNSNHPTSLAVGKDFIYFGTTGGIVPYNFYSKRFTEPYSVSDGLVNDNIQAVYYDKNTDYLWAGHAGGISYLTPTGDQWIYLSAQDVMSSVNPITRIGTYKDYIYAVASGGYIFRVSRIPGQLDYVPETNLSKLDIDWNISKNDPLPVINNYFFHPNKYELIKDGKIIGPELREFNVSLFYSDVRQNIYGGIWNLGLLTGDSNIQTLTLHPFGPLNNSINAITKIKNGFCMASSRSVRSPERSGITFFYPRDLEWEYVEPRFISDFPSQVINDVAYNNRQLWYATNQGVTINNRKNGGYHKLTVQDGLIGEDIYTIALEDSLAWVGSQLGLNLVYTGQYSVHRVHLTPDRFHTKILKIKIGSKDVWIGTDNGLYSVNRDDHKVKHYDTFGERIKLKQPVVSSYPAIATSDSLVIAYGYNSFLKHNLKKNEWSQLPDLPEVNIIYDLALYDNYLWAGTDKGAFLINLDNNSQEHYTKIDGLAGMHVYRVIIEDEDVWFGTNQGLTKYYWKKYAFTKN